MVALDPSVYLFLLSSLPSISLLLHPFAHLPTHLPTDQTLTTNGSLAECWDHKDAINMVPNHQELRDGRAHGTAV